MIQATNYSAESFYGRRIVFSGAAEDVNEPTLLQLFAKYGDIASDVKGLFLVRSALGLPSGCGYVTLASAEQAAAAAKALNGAADCAETGGKLNLLIVQLHPPSSNHDDNINTVVASTSISVAGPHKDSRTVFFTKIPPTVTAHQLIQLFSACGEVVHVELFTPWPGAKISKGCGLVEFATRNAASAAVYSLHQAFTWPHSHSPLVVEWVDSKRQQANRANKLSKAAYAAAAAAASDHPLRRARTAPMEKATTLMAAAPFRAGAGSSGLTTHDNTRSAPLPQRQSPWVQQPSSWAQQAALLQQQQQQQQMTAGASQVSQGYIGMADMQLRQLQQQQQEQIAAGNSSTGASAYSPVQFDLAQLQQRQQAQQLQHPSGGNSSMYQASHDTSGSLARLAGSTGNSATATNLSRQNWSSSSLADRSTSTAGLYAAAGIASPHQPSNAVAAAAALGAGRVDLMGQQLQQQDIRLLQPHSYSGQGESCNPSIMLSATASGFNQERERILGGAALAGHFPAGANTSMFAGQSDLATAGISPLAQQQQHQPSYSALVGTGSTLLPQPQQQPWWVQQPQLMQQMRKDESCVIIVPLTGHQLQVMSSVLPEVPRLTGAQACLTGGGVDGSIQLMLTGRMSQVQSAHSVVSMLLTRMGVQDSLMPAMAQHTA